MKTETARKACMLVPTEPVTVTLSLLMATTWLGLSRGWVMAIFNLTICLWVRKRWGGERDSDKHQNSSTTEVISWNDRLARHVPTYYLHHASFVLSWTATPDSQTPTVIKLLEREKRIYQASQLITDKLKDTSQILGLLLTSFPEAGSYF